MKIYIPSRARAEQANHTWENLPPALQERAVMVVHDDEVAAYAQRFPDARFITPRLKGIGNIRQFVIEISDGPVLMLDDDLRFFVRRKDDPTKFLKASPKDIRAMIDKMEASLSGYAHAAIAFREGGNRRTEDTLENTRCLRALGYNAAVLKKEGIRFDRLKVMEDFDVALQLLRKGYPSLTLNKWVQDQTTSNAPGGCSTYRTLDVQAKGARGLAKLHPDFVRLVEKETKGAWGGGKRLDVQVAWKKAYEEGLRHAR
jgi:hypothetical protein